MSTDYSDFTDPKITSNEWIEENSKKITDLGVLIWQFAEPALREFKSAEVICEFLREQGFEVEEGIGGMPTAFLGTYGSGKPVLATYAEYDAPAGNSQKAVPRKEPVVPYAPGHTQSCHGRAWDRGNHQDLRHPR
jgi:aminobenzoyl-glutamate utilization protein B